jgi:hypothetical protein
MGPALTNFLWKTASLVTSQPIIFTLPPSELFDKSESVFHLFIISSWYNLLHLQVFYGADGVALGVIGRWLVSHFSHSKGNR